MKPRKISRFVTIGDSLSDRGTMHDRYLLGFIPMSWLSGLRGESPAGRFTNGLAWSDHVIAMFSNVFVVNELKNPAKPPEKSALLNALDLDGDKKYKHGWDDSDIAEAIVRKDEKIKKQIQSSYNLNDDRMISYKGENLVRNYNEGGLTSFNYSWVINNILTWTRDSLKLFFSCLILATLGEKRSQLLADDRAQGLSRQHKAETLVIEWSGANDLITANARPTRDAVDKAVAARVSNIKELMKNGYQHFVWFNLPSLALTPRFQARSQAERDNADDCTNYFNSELEKAKKELAINYPHCSLELFDVNAIFKKVYENPADYNFDPAKLKEPYLNSEAFRINADGTSPATGYMFWDDVHPSADMHALLADEFYRQYSMKYGFSPPQDDAVEAKIHVSEDELLRAYRNVQRSSAGRERHTMFRSARPAQAQQDLNLEGILTQALHHGDKRALSVMKELQWFNKQGELNLNIPVLKRALDRVNAARRAPQREHVEREDARAPLLAAH